jgi:hypothetical protein
MAADQRNATKGKGRKQTLQDWFRNGSDSGTLKLFYGNEPSSFAASVLGSMSFIKAK